MMNGKSNEADAHEGSSGCSGGRQSKGSINDEGDSMCHNSRGAGPCSKMAADHRGWEVARSMTRVPKVKTG